jgi:peroxiredoxin
MNSLAALLCFSIGVVVQSAERAPSFTNDLGWTWQLKPWPLHAPASGMQDGAGGVMHWYPVGAHELLLGWAAPSPLPEALRWRPIGFSTSGERFEFAFKHSNGISNIDLRVYLLDLKTLPADQIKFIGIEKLTEDGFRNVRVPAAYRKLKAAGVEVLPVPRLGERYDFELTASDGKKIRAADLRGKVVLLDFWATTCPPCMAKMPHLKELYRKRHKDGFEIIGLNLDSTVAAAKRAIGKQALPWPNVAGPEDKSYRDLWAEATGTSAIPRLLLLDRNGILRADTLPDQLEAEVEKLMSKR